MPLQAFGARRFVLGDVVPDRGANEDGDDDGDHRGEEDELRLAQVQRESAMRQDQELLVPGEPLLDLERRFGGTDTMVHFRFELARLVQKVFRQILLQKGRRRWERGVTCMEKW